MGGYYPPVKPSPFEGKAYEKRAVEKLPPLLLSVIKSVKPITFKIIIKENNAA